ncbi:hypothetical protein [Spiroplasma endosymbiont of Amphibalanus improvisus]|uniref:hypothetical protein n=1 Tax=Spiroplasma endosymbiont of Amphibalanus improvisus TaxID=3066327 RepID=UPI00313D8B00
MARKISKNKTNQYLNLLEIKKDFVYSTNKDNMKVVVSSINYRDKSDYSTKDIEKYGNSIKYKFTCFPLYIESEIDNKDLKKYDKVSAVNNVGVNLYISVVHKTDLLIKDFVGSILFNGEEIQITHDSLDPRKWKTQNVNKDLDYTILVNYLNEKK